jgi:hypothetical protein
MLIFKNSKINWAHTCNSSIQETEAKGSQVSSQHGQHSQNLSQRTNKQKLLKNNHSTNENEKIKLSKKIKILKYWYF